MNPENWLDTAVSGIRFRPDRTEVRAELEGHIEDKIADLRRIFPDIPEEEARERALSGMGDPEELKIELAKVHRPWLGWLWRASQILAAATLALALLLWGGRALEDWGERLRVKASVAEGGQLESGYIEDCYQSGVDPYGEDGPWLSKAERVIRTPLASFQPEGAVWAGDYRFRVSRAGLFHFQNDPEDPGKWWLFCRLRVLGPPWAPVSWDVPYRLRAVDSAGNTYASSYEVYSLGLEHQGYVMSNLGRGNWLEERYDLTVIGIPPGAEWVRLEYDWLGTRWSLTVPLEIEEG